MRRRPPSKSSASGTTWATLAASTPGMARSARQQLIVELRPALGRVVEHRRIDGGDEDAATVEADVAAHGRPAGCARTGRRGRAARPRARPGRRPATPRSGSAARPVGQRPPRRLAALVEPARGLQRRDQAEGERGERRRGRRRPRSTVPSIAKSSRTGSGSGGRSRSSAASIHCASDETGAGRRSRRAAAPRRAAAARGARGSAPSDRRTATSSRRSAARATSRPATLAQATSSTSAHRQREHEQEAGHRPDGVGRQAQRCSPAHGHPARPRRGRPSTPAGSALCRPAATAVSCACDLGQRRAAAQPADDAQSAVPAARPARARRRRARRRRGRGRGRAAGRRSRRRGDADDRRRVAADRGSPRPMTAGSPSKRRCQKRWVRTTLARGRRVGERAARQPAGRAREAEDVEVVRADVLDEDALRLACRPSG